MLKFDERVWYRIFVCPHCGYRSCVTNVCRNCNEDADHKEIGTHGKPIRLSNMKPTEWAARFNPIRRKHERKKVKNLPSNAILK